jgi:hypothetical protein
MFTSKNHPSLTFLPLRKIRDTKQYTVEEGEKFNMNLKNY